jgi:uncharacterized lipoprotein YajG
MPNVRVVVLAVFVGAMLSGCAFSTAHVALDYQPSAERRSPLSTVPSRVIAVQLEDQRPPAERDRVADKKNGFGQVTAPVLSTKDVSAVIRDALTRELQNNGHTIASPAGPSDVVIKTVLKRYWANVSVRFTDIEMTGIITADITVTPTRNQAVAITRPVNTTLQEGALAGTDGAYESVLNKTLAEFVRNFSRETAVLDTLKATK